MASLIAPAPAKHDVFLSFRGEDAWDNFASHLYAGLCRKKIKTFICNEVNREEVTSVLLKEIEESKISVVIFSEDYVDSPRCLDELVKILECKRTRKHEIIPVFYSISALDIHDLVVRFDDASAKNSPNQDRDKVKKWKDALTEAANLSGWDFQTMRLESDITYGIVENILKKLNHASSSNGQRLFGIESHTEELGKKLSNISSEVQIVGIWGMGGIGKTTIAEAIFNEIRSQFEGCCFLANVREDAENRGLVRLRNELLSKILKKENLYTGAPMIGNNLLKRQLRCRKVLIVLDDVDDAKQLSYLVGERKWFNPGSRIIITTRDKHLLINGADETYEVKGLTYKDALLLFSWNAFRQDHPTEDRKEISKMFLKYAKGVPLALKVLGSFLHNRSREEWESAFSKLEGTPNIDIQTVLRVSYDGLEDEEKDIFLDIACFFRREMRDYVTKILDGYGFSADIGISVLIDKSLITVSDNEKIIMHDLLQKMGLEIVRQESVEEPGKRSRLLQHEDVHHVLTKKTGTETVEGILLDVSKIREADLSSDAFAKLHRLRFLRFYSSRYLGSPNSHEDRMFRELFGSRYYSSYKEGSMQLSQGLEALSNQLRFLQWHKFPLRSLPSNFCPRNLVELKLPHSHVEHLWNGVQDLVNLKKIDLSYSQNLIETPDLSRARNLEKMDLMGCTSLVEVSSSIQYLDKLDILELGGCKNLRSFPSNIHLRSLRKLSVSGCSNLKIFPEISWNVKELYINGTAIEEIPSSIRNFSKLVTLNMSKCSRIESLPDSICELKSLRNIYLGQSTIKELPSSIENMSGLTVLHLRECKNLVSLPDGICNLKSLNHLSLFGCSKLDKLPENLGNLKKLFELEVHETAIAQLPASMVHLNGLVELSFSGCKGKDVANFPLPPLSGLSSLIKLFLRDCGLIEFPAAITCLTKLERLDLAGNNFTIIPASIKRLVDLQQLDLTDCKRLQIIPELPPNLKYFSAKGCTSLETISSTKAVFPQWVDSLSRHTFLYTNCSSLDRNSRTNIMEDSKQKIQVLATACHKLYWRTYPTPSVTVSFPGSEIPEWFGYQNIGTSVTIPLPPPRGFPKFLGFVFSVVVAFKEDYNNDSDFTLRCESEYEDLYCNFIDGQRFDELDHIFLLYDHCLYLMGKEGGEREKEASFRFYAVDKNKQPLHSCTVKKCGVHLLFAPEEGRTQSSSLIHGNSPYGSSGKSIGRSAANKRYRDDSCSDEGEEEVKRSKGIN
ncbi:disease resistance protein RPV1-like [Euphorbia lathyris]|uniref:disease resistance protein RPV1-like n=1 Tax=Euphorbia lathyris TaxID=212925 RepID=UPI0033142F4F